MVKHSKLIHCACAIAVLVLSDAARAEAQVVRVDAGRHSVGFNFGYFWLRADHEEIDDLQSDWLFQRFPLDPNDVDAGRSRGDVLVADLLDFDDEPLAFSIKDFNGPTVGGEWNFAVSDYLETGVGVGFSQRTVRSVYLDVVNEDGREIEQELKLRVVPISATIKFLPIGRGGVEPYVGGGIGAFIWRYSEIGEFVDTSDYSIFRGRFEEEGTAFGPVILGGIRFPLADVSTIGAEIRYQRAVGKFNDDTELVGDRIDLGGVSASFTFHLRF